MRRFFNLSSRKICGIALAAAAAVVFLLCMWWAFGIGGMIGAAAGIFMIGSITGALILLCDD